MFGSEKNFLRESGTVESATISKIKHSSLFSLSFLKTIWIRQSLPVRLRSTPSQSTASLLICWRACGPGRKRKHGLEDEERDGRVTYVNLGLELRIVIHDKRDGRGRSDGWGRG
jgi:hypothetical protein